MAANLLVFDVSNLLCRIFHATNVGTPEDRLLNFSRARLRKSIAGLIRDVDPVRVVAAFDAPGGSFRNGLLPEYKAHRGEKHPLLVELLAEAPMIFAEAGCENLYAPGYEADDIIATVADQCLVVGGWRGVIVTNDADALSCVHDAGDGEGMFALRSHQGAYQLWGPDEVEASPKFGVPPGRITMFKTLQGDPSDGYVGVSGMGPVAARRLAKQYPNAKRLWAALDDPRAFTKGDRKKLEECGQERLFLMERVAKLVRNAPLQTIAA